MKNRYIKTFKLSLVLLLTTALVACGGGSGDDPEDDEVTECILDDGSIGSYDSDTDMCVAIGISNGITNTPGTGTCVNITPPKVGDTALIKNITILGEVTSETDVRTTYTAVSNTSRVYESEVASGAGLIEDIIPEALIPDDVDLSDLTIETTETFTIANNFIDITKTVSTSNTIGTVTTTYSPSWSSPFDKVCEGQIYTQKYTQTQAIPGGTDITEVDVRNTIEAVNVQKSVPAGTFNTFQVLADSDNGNITTWVDIASSTIVEMETRNEDGDVIGTASLISQEDP